MLRVSIILLFMLISAGVGGSRPSFRPVQLKFTNAANEPLKKLKVEALVNSQAFRLQFQTKLTTDDEGLAQLKLVTYLDTYTIRLEAKEFEDYTFTITPRTDRARTVEIVLNPVEEIEFVRLPWEPITKLEKVCKRPDFWDIKMPYRFANEQQWKDAWSAFKLEAPAVDFKKWGVVGFVARSSTLLPNLSVRRVTYNRKHKAGIVRITDIKHGDFHALAIDCQVDFVLIPARFPIQP